MKKSIIILSIFLSMNLAFSMGINQDYPSKFTMVEGESIIYGMRIVNPTNECIMFKIVNIGDNEIGEIINRKNVYHLPPNSTQKIYIKIEVPTNAKDNYNLNYEIIEVEPKGTNNLIDIAIASQTSIKVNVGQLGDKIDWIAPQNHPISEVNSNTYFDECKVYEEQKEHLSGGGIVSGNIYTSMSDEPKPQEFNIINIQEQNTENMKHYIILGAGIIIILLLFIGKDKLINKKTEIINEKPKLNTEIKKEEKTSIKFDFDKNQTKTLEDVLEGE